jgi:hypothetical protein
LVIFGVGCCLSNIISRLHRYGSIMFFGNYNGLQLQKTRRELQWLKLTLRNLVYAPGEEVYGAFECYFNKFKFTLKKENDGM